MATRSDTPARTRLRAAVRRQSWSKRPRTPAADLGADARHCLEVDCGIVLALHGPSQAFIGRFTHPASSRTRRYSAHARVRVGVQARE